MVEELTRGLRWVLYSMLVAETQETHWRRTDNFYTSCGTGSLFSSLLQMLTEGIFTQRFGPSWDHRLQFLKFSNHCLWCYASCFNFHINPFQNFTNTLPPFASLCRSKIKLLNAINAAKFTYRRARMPFWPEMRLNQMHQQLTSHNLSADVACILTNIPASPQFT